MADDAALARVALAAEEWRLPADSRCGGCGQHTRVRVHEEKRRGDAPPAIVVSAECPHCEPGLTPTVPVARTSCLPCAKATRTTA